MRANGAMYPRDTPSFIIRRGELAGERVGVGSNLCLTVRGGMGAGGGVRQ